MKAKGLLIVGILAAASTGWADVTVLWDWVDLGSGLYGTTYTVQADDGQLLPFFADATFEGVGGGVIQQIDPMGGPGFAVNSETDASNWDGVAGYSKALDSWFGDPFTLSPPAEISALNVAENYYHIESSTGAGSQYQSAKLAYIVCTGRVHVSLEITREGVNYPIYLIDPSFSVWPDADGPYQVGPGQSVMLDGSGSSAGFGEITEWLWDLDDDGQYDDASGEFTTVSYEYLAQDLGLGLGLHTIGLEAWVGPYAYWDSATLEIVPEPGGLALLGLGAFCLIRRRRR